jgi:SAM-dependent methyltransferase
LSPYAIGSVDYWQRIFGATLERRYACKSYATAERDASVELVFCFAAAHHFADHAATIRELHRILRPGGRALYLHEPTCGRLLYPWAHERVNAARPEVPEDLLIVADQRRMAEQAGLELEVLASHRLLDATFFPTLNYRLQRLVPPLGKLLPSCGTFVFTKPG